MQMRQLKRNIDSRFIKSIAMAVEIAKKAGFDTLLTLWPDGFHEEKI